MDQGQEQPHGFLLIDKPAGITSHDVVDRLRRLTGIRKIGHAGTLDPFATGLLILAIGRKATREIQQFVGMEKEYSAKIVLGATTETLDPEGEVQIDDGFQPIDEDKIAEAVKNLTGDLEQIPPMYSAIKIKGKKLYQLARKGEEIKREPRSVRVNSFIVHNISVENNLQILDVDISCSSGTYIRALARDLGEELGTVGYLTALRRSSIGSMSIQDAQKLEDLSESNWLESLKSLEEMSIDAD